MEQDKEEGQDPAAQQAAEEWRRRFGREGHEGSYAQHGSEADDKPAPDEEPSRTSPSG
jgi:hypothetical protein